MTSNCKLYIKSKSKNSVTPQSIPFVGFDQKNMRTFLVTLLWLAPQAIAAFDTNLPETFDEYVYEGQARTFYFNASNTATSVTILGIVILLGLITLLIYVSLALTPLSNKNFNRVQINNGQRR